MPEGDSLHRAAARLRPLVGLRLAASSPHPRGLVDRRSRRGRRAPARGCRGGWEASSAPVRGRRHGAQPSPHERPLARRPGRLDRGGAAVARPPWRGDRGDAVERPGADARYRAAAQARPGPSGGDDRADLARFGGSAPPRPAARWARCSRTSGSSPGSGTCGCRRRSGTSGSRRGFRSAAVTDDQLLAALESARVAMRASVAGSPAAPLGVPAPGPAVPALWGADRLAGTGR